MATQNNNNNEDVDLDIDTNNISPITDLSEKLIECQTCFRTFHTQAQFGQHSRICKGGKAVTRKFIDSSEQPYKYCFLERQNKDKLEIKSRFIVNCKSLNSSWKELSKKSGVTDSGIAQLLKELSLEIVHVAIRHRKESGLIVANFVIRNVKQTSHDIHCAKIQIENAVDAVMNKLPNNCEMIMHLCKINKCKELVIRDTEGYCSRHRAQKYHKINSKKRLRNKQLQLQLQLPPLKRQKQQQRQQQQQQQHNNLNQLRQLQQLHQIQQQQQQQQLLHQKTNQILYGYNNQHNMNDMVAYINANNNNYNYPSPLSSITSTLSSSLSSFLSCHTFLFETPSSLCGVRINKSPLRKNGMNILSVNYSTKTPNPRQVLKEKNQLIIFGPHSDTKNYINSLNEKNSLISLNEKNNKIRFPDFCKNLAKHYVECIHVPQCLIGQTLNQTPELSTAGINLIGVNLQIQHPYQMSNRQFKKNDLLICSFNKIDNKSLQLGNALKNIKNKSIAR